MQKVNLIPIMTSDTTPSGECKASSIDGGYTPAFMAFDENINTNWVNKYTCVSKWISYTFPSSTTVNEILFVYYKEKINWNSVDLYGDDHLLCHILESEGTVFDSSRKQINKKFNNGNMYKEYKLVFNSNNGDTANWIYVYIIKMYYNQTVKFLLKQNNQYCSIKPEYYQDGKFTPIAELNGKTVLTKEDYDTYGFNSENDLCTNMTVGTETFRPIDKFTGEVALRMWKSK